MVSRRAPARRAEYHAEIVFPDIVHAGLRVEHLRTSSVRYGVGLFRNDAEAASAEGHFVHVHVGRHDRRACAMGADLRVALSDLLVKG